MDQGMTLSDFAALEKMGNRHRGTAVTGLALGAVALGIGVIGTVAVGWGVNAASKARSRAAEQLAASQALRTNDLMSLVASERVSRENWQSANQPTISQTLSLQNNPSLQSTVQDIVTAMAAARAEANNSGISSAVSNDAALKVHLYQPPIPCQCNCNG